MITAQKAKENYEKTAKQVFEDGKYEKIFEHIDQKIRQASEHFRSVEISHNTLLGLFEGEHFNTLLFDKALEDKGFKIDWIFVPLMFTISAYIKISW